MSGAFDVDVVIVGGGPAGTSTALHLARAEGIAPGRVMMIDKATHPREKPCAGAVSAWGLRALETIGVGCEVPSAPMRGLRILVGGEVGATPCADLGVVVRRSEFDASLWRRAAADGVRAYDGEGLVALERVPGGWKLETSRGRLVRARFVAACDGSGSAIRKLLGMREHTRKGHLYVLETPLAAKDVALESGFCDFDLTPSDDGLEGYYWDFPTIIDGALHASRGIYHANFTARRDVKAQLARALALRGVDVDRVVLKPFSTRPLFRGATLAMDGLVLVGEAAGIDATTGEGIAQAILFGAIAAHHLARAARTGDARFDAYARAVWKSRLGRHLLQSAWLARAVYGRRGAGWRRFLLRSDSARAAGAAWYRGEPLSLGRKAALALGLTLEMAT